VVTQALLTGPEARVEAGPTVIQDEASLRANGILPWGPVQAIHTVTVGSTVYTVNQLTSPDPFSATYQLQNGSIVVSNEPLESIVTFTGDEGPQPPTVVWTSTWGDQWEVVSNRMCVYFDNEATEQELTQLIATENFHVVASWFEPPDAPGPGGGGMGAPGGGGKLASSASGIAGAPLGGGALLDISPLLGNEIAWFDFEFDRQRFATPEAAQQYFLQLPHVANAVPMICDYGEMAYAPPNDPLYSQPPNPGEYSKWPDCYDLVGYSPVSYFSYPGVQQEVAVMDCGVYRNHEDAGALSAIGVECYDRSYWLKVGGGVPDYKIDKPQYYGANTYWHRLNGHGTQVASIINSATNNGLGLPSLAPGATVMPIRLKQWTKTKDLPGVETWQPSFSITSHVKAVRCMRFELGHTKFAFMVRVVNMSFGYPSLVRQVPWPFKTQGDFKWNLARDLRWNDRLYVASAGNDIAGKLLYPAAHDLVLGVTGVQYNPNGRTLLERYTPQSRSNYMPDQTYPVSGVFNFNPNQDYSRTAVTPLDDPAYNPGTRSTEYMTFWGTSAAAPQVAALAYHLYSRRAAISGPYSTNRDEVRAQIVNTRLTEIEPYLLPWRAPISFRRAIDSW
jgi:hypothetical protein